MTEVRTTSATGGQKGVKLQRFDLIPVGPLTELAEHYGVGASKYANHQWRNGYEWSKSYAALMRHLTAFWAGFDYDVCSNDPEGCSRVDTEGRPFTAVREDACFNHTGSHHMAAVAWHAFCLMEFKDEFPEHDDRYRPAETAAEDQDELDFRILAERLGYAVGPLRPWTGTTSDIGIGIGDLSEQDDDHLPGARTVDHPRSRPVPFMGISIQQCSDVDTAIGPDLLRKHGRLSQ